jgi:hypothetical protein
MVIPKQFKLFGQTYEVRQPPKVMWQGDSVLGHCNSDDGIIQVRRNLKKELKELTYLHELTHAILYSLEYNKLSNDETFVERFSRALHQALTTQE